jgi:hypothetical protein
VISCTAAYLLKLDPIMGPLLIAEIQVFRGRNSSLLLGEPGINGNGFRGRKGKKKKIYIAFA